MSAAPNFLVIMSDQHSPDIIAAAGDPHVHTPHLDALCRAGTTCSEAICHSPICVPSRMSFLSGQTLQQTQCWGLSDTMRSDTVTWPVALGAAGYETAMSGRMHCWWPDKTFGFQQRLCGDHHTRVATGTWELYDDSPEAARQRDRLHDLWLAELHQGAVGLGPNHGLDEDREATTAACTFLRAHAQPERPFALCVGFICPHSPLRFPSPWYDRYADMPVAPCPLDPTLPPFAQLFARRLGADLPITPDAWARAVRAYYAMVTYLDALVGEMLTALDETGLARHTVVLYTSDHGEMLGRRGLWYKNQLLDPAIRVPFILRGPGVAANRRLPTPVSLLDVYPTLCQWGGAAPWPEIAGQSLAPLLAGGPPGDLADRPLFCEYADYGIGQPAVAVRRGWHKLIAVRTMTPVLYDLQVDPGETHDRYADPTLAAVRAQLTADLAAYWDPDETYRNVLRYQRQQQFWRRQQLLTTERPR